MNKELEKYKCWRCNVFKERNAFNKDRTTKSGYDRRCRTCIAEYAKTRNNYTERKKEYLKEYSKVKRHSPESGYKFKAREELNWAVRSSKLKRPDNCSKCIRNKNIEGHHSDYSKPLEVIWLCKLCHYEVDKQM